MQQLLKRRILKQIVHLTILITQFRYLLPVAEGESKPLGPDQGYVDCFRSLISFLFFFSFIVPVFFYLFYLFLLIYRIMNISILVRPS